MRLMRILAGCLLAAACQRDVLSEPPLPFDAAPAAALSAEEGAALGAALTDARDWLLPTLGDRAVATDSIAGRFADLASTLTRAEAGALPARIAAARRALVALHAEPSAERSLEVGALGLVLDDVEAVIQGRLQLAPHATAPDSLKSQEPEQRPELDRSVP